MLCLCMCFRVGGEDVRLMLWDTAGQEEFDAITKAYYRGRECVTWSCCSPVSHNVSQSVTLVPVSPSVSQSVTMCPSQSQCVPVSPSVSQSQCVPVSPKVSQSVPSSVPVSPSVSQSVTRCPSQSHRVSVSHTMSQSVTVCPSQSQCCSLWKLSCDFVPHNYETLKWLSSLPTLMQESFWWRQCSDRYIISLFPRLHTPFPPISPSLISPVVSVDVKHHVYFL